MQGAEEWRLIAGALIWGLELGFLYDCLWALRRGIRPGVFGICVCDVCFWSCTAVSGFRLMHDCSNGLLRWYGAGAALLALWIYVRCFSGLFRRTLTYLLRPINRLLTKIRRAGIIETAPSAKKPKRARRGDRHRRRRRKEADDGQRDVSDQDRVS